MSCFTVFALRTMFAHHEQFQHVSNATFDEFRGCPKQHRYEPMRADPMPSAKSTLRPLNLPAKKQRVTNGAEIPLDFTKVSVYFSSKVRPR